MTTNKQVLNLTAVKGEDKVSLQITNDFSVEEMMQAMKQWLDWGYSFEAGYDSVVVR